MRATVCGRFGSNDGGVVGYVDGMKAKYTAKWGVQMAGMNFPTHSECRRGKRVFPPSLLPPLLLYWQSFVCLSNPFWLLCKSAFVYFLCFGIF
ncbi:DUF6783 domain-containing protein [Candidatus Ventrimonas sp. KK005]